MPTVICLSMDLEEVDSIKYFKTESALFWYLKKYAENATGMSFKVKTLEQLLEKVGNFHWGDNNAKIVHIVRNNLDSKSKKQKIQGRSTSEHTYA